MRITQLRNAVRILRISCRTTRLELRIPVHTAANRVLLSIIIFLVRIFSTADDKMHTCNFPLVLNRFPKIREDSIINYRSGIGALLDSLERSEECVVLQGRFFFMSTRPSLIKRLE